MSDDDTLAGITEEIEPATTEVAYAWGSEPAEDFTEPADHVDQPATGAPVFAVLALAGLALAIAALAAVVVLVTPIRAGVVNHYSIRPAPVEQAPAPPPKAAPPPAAPAPVIVQPPVTAPLQPPPPVAPPDANQRFGASLAQGRMWQNEADDDQQARSLCRDLANGGSMDGYIAGTLRKSPQLTPARGDAGCSRCDRKLLPTVRPIARTETWVTIQRPGRGRESCALESPS